MENNSLTEQQFAALIARVKWNIEHYQRKIAETPEAAGCRMDLIINRIALAELESTK